MCSWGGYNLRSILKLSFLGGYWWEIDYLINAGGVYINGCVCKNGFYKPQVGDIIQLISSAGNYYRQQRLYTSFRRRFLLSRRNKGRQVRHYYSYFIRKLPCRSRWLFRTIYDKLDIPKHLEVDYLTQTVIVIYPPFLFNHFSSFLLRITH